MGINHPLYLNGTYSSLQGVAALLRAETALVNESREGRPRPPSTSHLTALRDEVHGGKRKFKGNVCRPQVRTTSGEIKVQ